MYNLIMKKVLIDENLLETATTALEQANIYLNALRQIAKERVATDEGKKLVKIAIDAIKHAEDTGVLSQTQID
jgi:hypothetical protein